MTYYFKPCTIITSKSPIALVRNKAQSCINIGGLSTGMAIAMLIGLWVADEWSALLTVSFQAISAAMSNPVKSLRSE